jgi:hypothetical protein
LIRAGQGPADRVNKVVGDAAGIGIPHGARAWFDRFMPPQMSANYWQLVLAPAPLIEPEALVEPRALVKPGTLIKPSVLIQAAPLIEPGDTPPPPFMALW